MQLKQKFLVKWNDKSRSQEPVDVGQEAEHRLDVLHLPENLGPYDGVGLEHLDKAINRLWIIVLITSKMRMGVQQRMNTVTTMTSIGTMAFMCIWERSVLKTIFL